MMAEGHGRLPFPFFVGCGRSGTTLLRAMFDSHPQMAVPPESWFVAGMARHPDTYAGPTGLDRDRFLADLLRSDRFRAWDLPPGDVRQTVDGANDLPQAFRGVFALYAERQGKARYADKTPSYVLELRLLADLFPEARFVHVIRDGRDVALSFRDMPFGPSSIAEGARFWRRRVIAGQRSGRSLGPSRYRELRYEDLIEHTGEVLRDLCDFLDLPFEDEMLRYHERAEEASRGVKFHEQHRAIERPPTRGLRDWRTQMSPADLSTFEALAGDLLGELGYERGEQNISGVDRAAALARLVGAMARKGLRRVKGQMSYGPP
jgi:hypothetical protein